MCFVAAVCVYNAYVQPVHCFAEKSLVFCDVVIIWLWRTGLSLT
jgi:hypothetical protein